MSFQFVDQGHELIDFGDYSALFGEGRKRNQHFAYIGETKAILDSSLRRIKLELRPRGSEQLSKVSTSAFRNKSKQASVLTSKA